MKLKAGYLAAKLRRWCLPVAVGMERLMSVSGVSEPTPHSHCAMAAYGIAQFCGLTSEERRRYAAPNALPK